MRKATLAENAGGLPGMFLNAVNKNTFTVGNFVFAEDPNIDSDILIHEKNHISQYEVAGPLFLPGYVVNQVIGWGLSKIFGGSTRKYNVFESRAATLREFNDYGWLG